jgi:hypothetical protein
LFLRVLDIQFFYLLLLLFCFSEFWCIYLQYYFVSLRFTSPIFYLLLLFLLLSNRDGTMFCLVHVFQLRRKRKYRNRHNGGLTY